MSENQAEDDHMALKKQHQMYVYIGIGLLVLYFLYAFVGGFIWFLAKTAFYVIVFVVLLLYLKKKGFFK